MGDCLYYRNIFIFCQCESCFEALFWQKNGFICVFYFSQSIMLYEEVCKY